jgi:hypothetical protein
VPGPASVPAWGFARGEVVGGDDADRAAALVDDGEAVDAERVHRDAGLVDAGLVDAGGSGERGGRAAGRTPRGEAAGPERRPRRARSVMARSSRGEVVDVEHLADAADGEGVLGGVAGGPEGHGLGYASVGGVGTKEQFDDHAAVVRNPSDAVRSVL